MHENTAAFKDFALHLTEIKNVRTIAESLETAVSDSNSIEVVLICEGALLALCGHIESYLKDLGRLLFSKLLSASYPLNDLPHSFLYYLFKDKIDSIFNSYNQDNHKKLFALLDELSATKLMKSNEIDMNLLNIENIIEGFSIPKFKGIINYFKRFGFNDFEEKFNKKHKANAIVMRQNYDSVIVSRNAIAHGYSSRTISPKKLSEIEEEILYFCNSIDNLFSDWCEKNLCPIR